MSDALAGGGVGPRGVYRSRPGARGLHGGGPSTRGSGRGRAIGGDPGARLATNAVTFANNITASYNVVAAARSAGIRNVVWASSETVLGLPFDTPPRGEAWSAGTLRAMASWVRQGFVTGTGRALSRASLGRPATDPPDGASDCLPDHQQGICRCAHRLTILIRGDRSSTSAVGPCFTAQS